MRKKKKGVGLYIHVDLILLHTAHPNITAATQNQLGRVIYPTRSQIPFEEQDKGPKWSYPASKLPTSQSNPTSVRCNRTADGSVDLPHKRKNIHSWCPGVRACIMSTFCAWEEHIYKSWPAEQPVGTVKRRKLCWPWHLISVCCRYIAWGQSFICWQPTGAWCLIVQHILS